MGEAAKVDPPDWNQPGGVEQNGGWKQDEDSRPCQRAMPGELCSSRNHNDDKLAARKGGVKSEGLRRSQPPCFQTKPVGTSSFRISGFWVAMLRHVCY